MSRYRHISLIEVVNVYVLYICKDEYCVMYKQRASEELSLALSL